MAMLEIKDIHKTFYTYDDKPRFHIGPFPRGNARRVRSALHVLNGVDLSVEKGDVVAILGPSGSGKTTLLRCLNFLETADAGQLTFDGETFDLAQASRADIARLRKKTAFVFQSYNLFRNKTALQNVTEGLIIARKMPKEQADAVGMKMLKKVGLADRADYYPRQLSGGQQQRVAIARALALRPSVLLADEATSGLDPQATASVLALLKRLRDEYQLAIVLITHEMDAVRTAADAVAEIRDGTIVQYGRIEDLLGRPDSLLGQQLLPLTPAAAAHSDLLLRLSYRWDVPVATDWISRLSQQWALQIDLLGGHVEVINGRLAGRLQAGVRFQGERLSPARLQGLLAQLGITAEILDSAPLLREAV